MELNLCPLTGDTEIHDNLSQTNKEESCINNKLTYNNSYNCDEDYSPVDQCQRILKGAGEEVK